MSDQADVTIAEAEKRVVKPEKEWPQPPRAGLGSLVAFLNGFEQGGAQHWGEHQRDNHGQ